MKKNKQKKYVPNFIDRTTLKRLKILIIISTFLCLVCELLPSVFDICKIFNYNPVIVFIQPHKDFIVNLLLGCIGSAVISYFMLYISCKIKEQENIATISVSIKNVISNFLMLYYILIDSINAKNIEDVDIYENSIETEKRLLLGSIKELFDNYGRISTDNQIVNEVVDICKNKLLLMIKEIDIFLNVFQTFKSTDYKGIYSVDVFNDIYKVMYKNLNNNYCLNDVKEKFEKIAPNIIAGQETIEDFINSLQKYNETYDYISTHLFYVKEISTIFQKYSYKRKRDIIKDRKRLIIENVNKNIDFLDYGKKIVEDNIVWYLVNEKKMIVEEYKEYCIKEEFKKEGLDKINL